MTLRKGAGVLIFSYGNLEIPLPQSLLITECYHCLKLFLIECVNELLLLARMGGTTASSVIFLNFKLFSLRNGLYCLSSLYGVALKSGSSPASQHDSSLSQPSLGLPLSNNGPWLLFPVLTLHLSPCVCQALCQGHRRLRGASYHLRMRETQPGSAGAAVGIGVKQNTVPSASGAGVGVGCEP